VGADRRDRNQPETLPIFHRESSVGIKSAHLADSPAHALSAGSISTLALVHRAATEGGSTGAAGSVVTISGISMRMEVPFPGWLSIFILKSWP